jgi:hypothetical protein
MASLYNTVASHLKYPGRQMGIGAEDDESFAKGGESPARMSRQHTPSSTEELPNTS